MTDTGDALPPEEPFPSENVSDEADERDDSLIGRMRHTGVGVEDPHIVGDVGPTDIPPGVDPDSAAEHGDR